MKEEQDARARAMLLAELGRRLAKKAALAKVVAQLLEGHEQCTADVAREVADSVQHILRMLEPAGEEQQPKQFSVIRARDGGRVLPSKTKRPLLDTVAVNRFSRRQP
jgi:hypothetical protein